MTCFWDLLDCIHCVLTKTIRIELCSFEKDFFLVMDDVIESVN